MLFENIKNLVIWACLVLPSLALAGSEQAPQASLSDNIPVSDIVLVVTLLAGLLTIISVARGKQPSKKEVEEDELTTLKNELREEYRELQDKISDLTKIDAATKIQGLQDHFSALDDTVNNYIKKQIYTLSEHFNMLDSRVTDLTKHFDEASAERKEENRQLRNEINTLRENIREDINDVKDIIMKLMMALNTDED